MTLGKSLQNFLAVVVVHACMYVRWYVHVATASWMLNVIWLCMTS